MKFGVELPVAEAPITAKDGLLYRDGKVVELPEADRLAQERGYPYAEQLVKALEK